MRPNRTTRNGMPRGRRWLRRFLSMLVVLLLATLVASYFWQPAFLKADTASLPGFAALSAQAPAATLSATATALSGADFELLNDPDGERIARDLDLYAWYAAGPNAPETNPNTPAPLPENTAPETTAPDNEEGGGGQ